MASSSSGSGSGFGGSSNGQGFGGFGSGFGPGHGSDKPQSPPTTPTRPAPVRPARVYHNIDAAPSSPIGTQYTYSPGGIAQPPTAPTIPAVVLAPIPGRPQTPETPVDDGRFELRDNRRDVSPTTTLEDGSLRSYLPPVCRVARVTAALIRVQHTSLILQTVVALSGIPDNTETMIDHPAPRGPSSFGPTIQETFDCRAAEEKRLAREALAADPRPSTPPPQAEEALPSPPPPPPSMGNKRHPKDKGPDESKKPDGLDRIR
ncbi:hypothetical protein IFR05_000117 [Cadophora sp. M221]|nr:hypothetical protein IFR05_000117 [Cadophora sp. M221]